MHAKIPPETRKINEKINTKKNNKLKMEHGLSLREHIEKKKKENFNIICFFQSFSVVRPAVMETTNYEVMINNKAN